ncbi:ATP-binding protein [Nonomuraea sp. NPDC023979]|uniref:ATP-binding protein n=1 Tax=Nonomuraea sp. NPDC023979 TaxID=3154796 RepID=UPI0033DB7769
MVYYAPPPQLKAIGTAHLARSNRAPRLARRAVAVWLERAHPAREITTLAVSELVTNAVQHPDNTHPATVPVGTQDLITVTLSQGSDYLRLAVTDPGSSSQPSIIPLQAPNLHAERGRGLAIVEALSRGRWGSYLLPPAGQRLVWCHLDLDPIPAQDDALFYAPHSRSTSPSDMLVP